MQKRRNSDKEKYIIFACYVFLVIFVADLIIFIYSLYKTL